MDRCQYYDKCVLCQLTDCGMHGTVSDANEHLLLAFGRLIEEILLCLRAALGRAEKLASKVIR